MQSQSAFQTFAAGQVSGARVTHHWVAVLDGQQAAPQALLLICQLVGWLSKGYINGQLFYILCISCMHIL